MRATLARQTTVEHPYEHVLTVDHPLARRPHQRRAGPRSRVDPHRWSRSAGTDPWAGYHEDWVPTEGVRRPDQPPPDRALTRPEPLGRGLLGGSDAVWWPAARLRTTTPLNDLSEHGQGEDAEAEHDVKAEARDRERRLDDLGRAFGKTPSRP